MLFRGFISAFFVSVSLFRSLINITLFRLCIPLQTPYLYLYFSPLLCSPEVLSPSLFPVSPMLFRSLITISHFLPLHCSSDVLSPSPFFFLRTALQTCYLHLIFFALVAFPLPALRTSFPAPTFLSCRRVANSLLWLFSLLPSASSRAALPSICNSLTSFLHAGLWISDVLAAVWENKVI